MSHHIPPVAVVIAHRGADDPNMVYIGHAVIQELGAPNRLIIYHQAEDLAALRAFAGSEDGCFHRRNPTRRPPRGGWPDR